MQIGDCVWEDFSPAVIAEFFREVTKLKCSVSMLNSVIISTYKVMDQLVVIAVFYEAFQHCLDWNVAQS